MGLAFADSFDGYANPADKWGINNGATIGSFGRNGTNGLRLASNAARVHLQVPGHPAKVTFGFGCRPASGAGNQVLWQTYDDSGPTSVVQMTATLLPDGSLRYDRGASGAFLLAVTTTQLRFGSYQYLEFQYTPDVSVLGSCLWHINGAPAFDLTALNTAASGNPWASRIRLGDTGTGFGGIIDIDDFYLLDDQPGLDDFLGDIRIHLRRPNGAGTNTTWTPGGAVPQPTNWESVDEAAANDATDWVATSLAGQRDSYTYEDLTTTAGQVIAAVIQPRVRKTNAGTRRIRGFARHGGVEAECDSPAVISSDFAYLTQPMILNPSTGLAFTIPEFNAAEFGLEVV